MVKKVEPAGVGAAEHAARRQRVLERIEGGVMILPAGAPPVYSNDNDYRFRSHSDFFYLTGYPEPEALAVLRPGAEHPYTLFVRPRDPEMETWTGRRTGPEGAVDGYGADAAYTIDEFPDKLPGLLDEAEVLYYEPWADAALDGRIRSTLAALERKERFGLVAPRIIVRPAEILHEMRLIKTAAEVDVLARAAALSAEGHRAAMAACRPGMMEFELQGVLESRFLLGGAAGPGFSTIVGAGDNGCILHYIENNHRIEAGDLVLVDAGAEYGGYNGDITRTFPAWGAFDAAQRDLYQVVLGALEAGIAAARPGATIDGIHEQTLRMLTEGLISLGALEGSVDEALEAEAFKKYYMHRTSHWLGMDVHDVGRYRRSGGSRPLEPGMVFTIEPGLYLPAGDESLPTGLRGQAVRIEDDVVITEEGCTVLTRDVPVDPDAVEALVGSEASS